MTQAVRNGGSVQHGVDWEARVRSNQILSQVSPDTLDELLQQAEFVFLKRGDRLDRWFNRGSVLFPLSGIFGGVLETEDGDCIQPVFIGSQGVLGGMRAVHGMPFFLTYKVRLAGEAIVVSAAVVRDLAAQSPTLRVALARASARKFRLAASHAVCARFHDLSTRCCAWLSLVHQETNDDVVPITHEELAEVVGATRPAVSAALSQLTREGLILSIRRGAIRLIDPELVARQACGCWQTPDLIAAEWEPQAEW